MKDKKSLILLVNLGSPEQLSVRAIKAFLAVFLADKRVVNLPRILWYPILYGIILPFRSKKLFSLYSNIWHKTDKSPLTYYTEEQARVLGEIVATDIEVRHAFSYSNPRIEDVLEEMHSKYEITNLKVIPLYPQFSSTTTSSVFDQVATFYKNKCYLSGVSFVRDFHKNNDYIELIVNKIKKSWENIGQADKLVLSYHSLPVSVIKKGDSYFEECIHTSELIVEKLGLTQDQYVVTFQSKFGRQEWLTPATLPELIKLAQNGVSIDIVCPGFVSDCLETLEEISVTNKDLFIQNGGKTYNYINCLNDDEDFIRFLAQI